MVFRVALTGGIASGKSTVARLFAALSVPVIDSDVIAREVVHKGQPALAAIRERFGQSVLAPDGTLDRAALRQRIFSNPEEKQALEDILHPRIRALMAQRSATAGGPYQIFEIPLLAETGGREFVDRVLVIDCDPERQIERVLARDGVQREHAEQILAQQATREQRLAIADDVIVNDTSRDVLAVRVLALHRDYLTMAKTPR